MFGGIEALVGPDCDGIYRVEAVRPWSYSLGERKFALLEYVIASQLEGRIRRSCFTPGIGFTRYQEQNDSEATANYKLVDFLVQP